MIRSRYRLNEDTPEVQQLPQGSDDYSKALRVKEVLKNKFLSVTVEDGLKNLSSVEKLLEDLDKAVNALSSLINKYDDVDEDMFDKLSDVQLDVTSMWNCLHDIVNAFEENQHLIKKLKLQ